ncbi:unnamed protein product [Caenorhabditis angaria]|uniref:Uncharacterized protein n=1 Tax=Caenorhabditis angaria TaxID=860376 RepID=A0A9P1N5Q0_9PELO|nr:unnamed protein product [Caenorhabditis angaria]
MSVPAPHPPGNENSPAPNGYGGLMPKDCPPQVYPPSIESLMAKTKGSRTCSLIGVIASSLLFLIVGSLSILSRTSTTIAILSPP